MADINAIPVSFEEAKELARRNMLTVRAQAENDAKQAAQQDDEDEAVEDEDQGEEDADAAEAGDADETQEAEDDDDQEDDDDESESDDTDDDERDDDEDSQSKKRKPSRRSKKIEKLQDRIKQLEAANSDSEERLLQRLRDEQARRAALEAEQRQREAEDRALETEMSEYLGSDQEYRAAVRAALNGDPFEAEKAKAWDERREIFGKLTRRAETRVNQRVAEIFWQATEGLSGVDREVLQKAEFGQVLKHLHDAGAQAAEKKSKAEIDKRDAKIARLEAQLKSKSVKRAATATKTPLEGGTPVKSEPKKSIYQQSMNEDGTINREKFERLRRNATLNRPM